MRDTALTLHSHCAKSIPVDLQIWKCFADVNSFHVHVFLSDLSQFFLLPEKSSLTPCMKKQSLPICLWHLPIHFAEFPFLVLIIIGHEIYLLVFFFYVFLHWNFYKLYEVKNFIHVLINWILFFIFLRLHMQHTKVPWARGQIGAAAAYLHHSQSNAGSEPHLWPTHQLTAMPDP